MTALNGWENFYIIVGSSAGALIGLQFVVIALIAERRAVRTWQTGAAFATPSVVHFGVVLLLSSVVSAPWDGIETVAILWGLLGLCGIVYTIIVARRMRMQTDYEPVFEDWLFHALLPLTAYVVLALSALIVRPNARPALFLVGAGALLLLFTGIHNAWDAATYHVFAGKQQQTGGSR
ncbi:MAG TPA: hypothetical protein VIS48_04250 [Candidatus Kryptonia bacterium]